MSWNRFQLTELGGRLGWVAMAFLVGTVATSLETPVKACQTPDAPAVESDQEESDEEKDTVTVRGQLVLADPNSDFDIKQMPVVLDEFTTPPKLPLPDNFAEMTMEDRQKWYANFIESDAGKVYERQVEEIQEKRHFQETSADEDGRFVFKEVKRSHFGLYGQKEFMKDGKTFMAEFQAEFAIEEKVKFIELDRLPVVIKRMLQVGEEAPDLRLKKEGDHAVEAISKYKGKNVLLYFWTIGSAQHIQPELKKAVEAKLDLEILGVNLNQPGDERDQYLSENPTQWANLVTDGLDGSPVTIDYSVNQLPSMWLIDKNGKVMVTDLQFLLALSGPDADLTDTLKKALAGELKVEIPEQQ